MLSSTTSSCRSSGSQGRPTSPTTCPLYKHSDLGNLTDAPKAGQRSCFWRLHHRGHQLPHRRHRAVRGHQGHQHPHQTGRQEASAARSADPGGRSPHRRSATSSPSAESQRFSRRSRSALAMTLTDESAIAAAAITGDSVRPNMGKARRPRPACRRRCRGTRKRDSDGYCASSPRQWRARTRPARSPFNSVIPALSSRRRFPCPSRCRRRRRRAPARR